MDWMSNFFIPIIKTTFFIGIFGFLGYVVFRALYRMWQQQWKYLYKYKIRKKQYPEKTVIWCIDAIENGIGYYECKKLLLIKGVFEEQRNETLWIYDKLLLEMKGGKENGRKYERISGAIAKTKRDLPTI